MNTLIVLSALLAAACAAPSYNYGYAGANHANHYNGVRQAYVNRLAEKLGAGTGTANKDGVPGTYVTNGLAAHGDVYGYGHGYGHGYGQGYGHGYGQGYGHGYGVYPDQYNALRQKYVNKQAEAVGAGTGTYKDNGVPGTFLDKNHYG